MTATFPLTLPGSIIDPRFGAIAMNANLFDRLDRSIADLTSTAITTPAGETRQLRRPGRPVGPPRQRARRPRRQARRPGRGPGREVGAGPGPVSGHRPRRRRLSAAQHRLYPRRAGVLHRRCRAVTGRLRSGQAGRGRVSSPQRSEHPSKRSTRKGRAPSRMPQPMPQTSSRRWSGRAMTWPRSSTPRARPAAPRAPC